MSVEVVVDAEPLHEKVRQKHRWRPTRTGRPLAARLGYDAKIVDALLDAAIESFAGVANPLALRPLVAVERVVEVGSGTGFNCFIAAHHIGLSGPVVGIDMTDETLSKGPRHALSRHRWTSHMPGCTRGLAENPARCVG